MFSQDFTTQVIVLDGVFDTPGFTIPAGTNITYQTLTIRDFDDGSFPNEIIFTNLNSGTQDIDSRFYINEVFIGVRDDIFPDGFTREYVLETDVGEIRGRAIVFAGQTYIFAADIFDPFPEQQAITITEDSFIFSGMSSFFGQSQFDIRTGYQFTGDAFFFADDFSGDISFVGEVTINDGANFNTGIVETPFEQLVRIEGEYVDNGGFTRTLQSEFNPTSLQEGTAVIVHDGGLVGNIRVVRFSEETSPTTIAELYLFDEAQLAAEGLTASDVTAVGNFIAGDHGTEAWEDLGLTLLPSNFLGLNEDDSFTGTPLDDILTGNGGEDLLKGVAGNDTIIGGLGDDTLDGGDGVDTVDGSARNQDWVVNLNSGVANITGVETNTLSSIENFIGGSGDDTVFGSAEDNVLTGNAGDDLLAGLNGTDTLDGGLGNDSLSGGNGDDTLEGGDGDDRLFGNNDNDTIMGGAGNDFTNGGNGDDVIFGGDDDDSVLVGGAGNDEIHGEEGNDAINGSSGDDDLFGGNGNDNLFGGDGEDTLNGGSGDDTLGGLGDNDLIIGGAGDDGINGGGGDDTLFGFAGADRLFGGTGDDVLNGGTGNDLLVGQAGVDRFVFTNNWGNDQISQYGVVATGAPRVDETIDLSNLLDSGGDAVDFADLTFTYDPMVSPHTTITVDGHDGNSIVVLFRAVTEFTVDDFAFG